MAKQQQAPAAEQDPPLKNYGMTPERASELIPVADRADPDNPDTGCFIADIAEETWDKYFWYLTIRPTPRLKKTQRRSAHAITHGDAKPRERTDAA